MVLGMGLEALGIGLVVPAIALLTQGNPAESYPQARPLLRALGDPTHTQLIVGGMVCLVAIPIKTLFLGVLTWRQNRFAFGVQAELSERLFTTYLRQPYTFLLQRNSSELIRNIITEVNQFTGTDPAAMLLMTEGLVVLGVATLLLVVEPVGTLVVVVGMGGAAWAFHHVRAPASRAGAWPASITRGLAPPPPGRLGRCERREAPGAGGSLSGAIPRAQRAGRHGRERQMT